MESLTLDAFRASVLGVDALLGGVRWVDVDSSPELLGSLGLS